jgi:hypothetical protein
MNISKAEGVNNMDRYVPGQDVYNIYNNIRQCTKKFGLYQVLVASTNLEYSKRQCGVQPFHCLLGLLTGVYVSLRF